MLYDLSYSQNNNLWYNIYHKNTDYNIPEKIGLDINILKYFGHGIELRIFDYFDEKYLVDIINIIILICQFSLSNDVDTPYGNYAWNLGAVGCVTYGSFSIVNSMYISKICRLFGVKIFLGSSPYGLLQYISNALYDNYRNGDFALKISPNMNRPIVHNYNREMFDSHKANFQMK